MRTVTKTLMIALCSVLMSGAVSATDPAAALQTEVGQTDDAAKKAPFRVGMYRIIHSLTMNVLVEKQLGERVVVKLLDPRGHVLFEDILGRKQQKYGRKFDFSQVADGRYSMVITNGDKEVVNDIQLATYTLYEMPARNLVTLK